MKNPDYIPYQKIAGAIGIGKGQVLWLAADLTGLALNARKKEKEFDTRKFIGSFLDHLGDEGTLVISAFNHNLKDKDQFSRSRTLPITGALAVEAMKMNDFRRTRHPLHSFLVSGKETGTLCNLRNKSSFGPDSPFAFLHNHQAMMLILGTPLSNAFTFVHYVEELCKVKYRKYRRYRILQLDEREWEEYLLYKKNMGWTMEMSGLEMALVNSGIAVKTRINGIPCTIVDIAKSFEAVKSEITQNNARNIACFSSNLYFRDMTKQLLGQIGFYTKSDRISRAPGIH